MSSRLMFVPRQALARSIGRLNNLRNPPMIIGLTKCCPPQTTALVYPTMSFSNRSTFSTAAALEVEDEDDYDEDQYYEPERTKPMPSKNNLATIRLYRMLLRQCKELIDAETKTDFECIMLQPKIHEPFSEPRYIKTGPPVVTHSEDIFRLFYTLVDSDNKPKNDVNEKLDQYRGNPHKRNGNQRSVLNVDHSIDDWFYEVSGGVIPSFPGDADDIDEWRPLLTKTCWTSRSQLKEILKQAFSTSFKRVEPSSLTLLAIRATQALREQQDLWKKSSVAMTDGIRVIATQKSIGKVAVHTPDKKRGYIYRFSYRIRIENLSPYNVKLLGRSTEVQDLEVDEVPNWDDPTRSFSRKKRANDIDVSQSCGYANVLRPGQCFEFLAATDLLTPDGRLGGRFRMMKVLPASEVTPENEVDSELGPINARVAPLQLISEGIDG